MSMILNYEKLVSKTQYIMSCLIESVNNIICLVYVKFTRTVTKMLL